MDNNLVGKLVKVVSGRDSGKSGSIVEVFPAGRYENEEVVMVKYTDGSGCGMFPFSAVDYVLGH